MHAQSVDVQQSRNLESAAAALLEQAEAEAVLVVHRDGHALASAERQGVLPMDSVSALAAGIFAATRELAGLLSEREFRCLSHEGSQRSILMQSIRNDFIVVVVFGRNTTLGLVKLYTDRMIEEVSPVLTRVALQVPVETGITEEFILDPARPLWPVGDSFGDR